MFASRAPRFAYAIIKLPDDEWRYELMDMDELDDIRKRSPAWQKNVGPWVSDDLEMRKKTVIKRALKTYCDDPAIVRALQLDDQEYEELPMVAAREPVRMPRALPRQAREEPPGDLAEGEVPNSQPPPTSEEIDRNGLEDTIDGLKQKIEMAETKKALEAVGVDMLKQRELLGEVHYDTLLKLYHDKFKAISKPR